MWQSDILLLSLVLLVANLNIFELGCEAGIQLKQERLEREYVVNHHYQNNTFNKIPSEYDQTLVVRLPSKNLLKYSSYKDVSILHFRVPEDTHTAVFTFKAFEESKSAFQRTCAPRSVTIHLKASSYPVISPENITFPQNYLDAGQRLKIYNMEMKSDDKEQQIVIEAPQFGNWFAIAFISWTDPNNDRIEQQGLTASCDTLLSAELSVTRFQPIILTNQQTYANSLIVNNIRNETSSMGTKSHLKTKNTHEHIYKFYIPTRIGAGSAYFQILSYCEICPNLSISIRSAAYPQRTDQRDANNYNGLSSSNDMDNVTYDFETQPNTWHYLKVEFDKPDFNVYKNSTFELDYSLQLVYQETETETETVTENEESEQEKDVNKYAKHYRFRNFQFFPLLRQTYREFFIYDYDLHPDENDTVPLMLNLTANSLAGFPLDIGDVYDIGGTLTFALTMKTEKHAKDAIKLSPTISTETERSVLVAEKLIWTNESSKTTDPSDKVEVKLSPVNQTIIVCMHLGDPYTPTWPNKCVFGKQSFPAALIVNNTDLSSASGIINVPYPESGVWYITMGLFCHGGGAAARNAIIESIKKFVTKNANHIKNFKPPCACANYTDKYYTCLQDPTCIWELNDTDVFRIKECLMDSKCHANYLQLSKNFEVQYKLATEKQKIADICNASIIFSLASNPCVSGRCGRFGRCYHYMSGGFVFSTCVCMKGYRGWDCTEDSNVPSNISILLASLLLTLSNLLFLPSVFIAVKRAYYTEAVIYFFAMFFSIFYHACDSGEDEYSFCLVKIAVLQFCDFYCGLLAIWVTLVAMSHARQQIVSLLHMLGAILLAFGTELDKQSLWVFLAPALTGICLIAVSWGLRCHKTKSLYPSPKYWRISLPLGSVLVMIGLVCYAFLQTKQNYHIVHSIWHMVMALSLLCLLPSHNSFLRKS